ncbi:MAG: universal stress protein [candidate division KSB1 bacterium]|nr:universal stress protein [candidate division KSB1 bacterium]
MPEVSNSWSPPKAALVAMDFSAPSRRALELALSWLGEAEITVLHVVDTDFAERVDAEGIASRSQVVQRLRGQAESELAAIVASGSAGKVEKIIVEGSPFVEIVKLARDLDVDCIVMGMRSAERRLGELLSGSTAERVLRASHCPVICVP